MEAAELRRRRAALGLSQTEMARRLLVSPRTLQEWEQGRRRMLHGALIRREIERLEAGRTRE